MRRVALHTLGCKLNFSETSTIGRQFVENGFEVVDFNDPSDVYVLNTCSVTERADRECRQIIRRALRTSPRAYVVVVGCYAQLQPGEIAAIEGVDLVLGAKEKFDILRHAGNFHKQSIPQVFVSCIDEADDFSPSYSAEVGGRTRAFLKVQDGCDFHCAFCTIPLARGESRSQSVDGVLRQVREILNQGYKEIVLTGVNVGDFGRKSDSSLMELMKALEDVDGLERVRISSIEPNLLTPPMIDHILASDKFCNHFHIPLQSGSDEILHRMRRRYVSGHYRHLVQYIKEKDPSAAIGADIITGFPGETEDRFNESFGFLASLPISYLHVFTYSERGNTPAISMDGMVEPRIRQERTRILRDLGQRMRREYSTSFVGTQLPVLFEGRSRGNTSSGLTPNYLRVEVASNRSLINEIHRVHITGAGDDHCVGRLIGYESSDDLNNFRDPNETSATMNPPVHALSPEVR